MKSISSLLFFSITQLLLLHIPLTTSIPPSKNPARAPLSKRAPAEIYCPAPLPAHTPPNSPPPSNAAETPITYPAAFPITLFSTLDDLCWARFTTQRQDPSSDPETIYEAANAGCECIHVDNVGYIPQCYSPPGADQLTNNGAIREYCILHCQCIVAPDSDSDDDNGPPVTIQKPKPAPLRKPTYSIIDWAKICEAQRLGYDLQRQAREGFEELPFRGGGEAGEAGGQGRQGGQGDEVVVVKDGGGSVYCRLSDRTACCTGQRCKPSFGDRVGFVTDVLMGVLGSGLSGVGSCS